MGASPLCFWWCAAWMRNHICCDMLEYMADKMSRCISIICFPYVFIYDAILAPLMLWIIDWYVPLGGSDSASNSISDFESRVFDVILVCGYWIGGCDIVIFDFDFSLLYGVYILDSDIYIDFEAWFIWDYVFIWCLYIEAWLNCDFFLCFWIEEKKLKCYMSIYIGSINKWREKNNI